MAIEAHMYAENFGSALDNVCGFDNLCFVPQPQQQQQQQFDHQLQLQSFSHQKNQSFFPQNNIQQSVDSFSAHFEKQRMEIDQFINLQNERLRQAIQEQRKQQITTLMKKYEARAQILLKQKDEEIAKASNRSMELQILLKRIEIENQTWQRVAKENEAMIGSLNETIQRLRENACLSANANAAEDAESYCQNADEEEPKTSNIEKNKMCKCCNSRKSSMIVLPCRHLCSCRDCEVFLDTCPVCRMVKKASIEALF